MAMLSPSTVKALQPAHDRDEGLGLTRTWERIALAVAAGAALAAGCGPRVVDDGGSAGGSAGSDASSSGGAAATSSPGSTTQSTTRGSGSDAPPMTSQGMGSEDDPDGSADEGPKFDVEGVPDGGPGPEPSDCFELPPLEPACDVELDQTQLLGFRCMPQEVEFSCEGITPEEAQAEAEGCLGCGGSVHEVPCGPIGSGTDTCCHWFVYALDQTCPPGRPFTVDGCSRLPGVVPRSDWAETIAIDLAGLPLATRRALALAWAQDGCFEHASIASFARFVLELLAVGAPASLVADAQRALLDETAHARAFFGLAAAYGACDVGPDTLDVRDALRSSHDPLAIAESLVREGCIGETISALQLQVAAARATDPQVRARLLAIADEELRHAELAWSALAWLLAGGDARIRERVAHTFTQAACFVPRSADASDELPSVVLHAHGRLGADERLALAERALERLVAPAAAQLLEPWTVAAPLPSSATTPA